eukprot:GFUD01027888.1.p1 GENE.GFUD01027888.1~~GFUD01027888.1.p1  ORF type:complete len:423 (+),score=69.54 GFUD01027888.1:168-1436(+)
MDRSDRWKQSCKPNLLGHQGLSRRQQQTVEMVPIFLEKKNKSRNCSAHVIGTKDPHENVSVDILNEHKLDSLVDSMNQIDSNLDEDLESVDYSEIIVTVEDDRFDYVQTGIDLENCSESKIESNPVPDNQNATLDLSESASTQRETYRCVEAGCDSQLFSSYRLFRDHYIMLHDKFPLECLICGKRYKEKHSLQNHLETHSGEEKYPCEVCQKRFKTKERLLVHRQLHQGRRFFCDCGFKARCQRSLRKHMVMKHGQRRFGCTFCIKAFASRQNLEAHARIHTGETPWECYLCDSKFNRIHHFRQHLSTNLHIKMINNLVTSGGEIPDLLNPEKNVPKKRDVIEEVPEQYVELNANEKSVTERTLKTHSKDDSVMESASENYPFHLDDGQSLCGAMISFDSIDGSQNIAKDFAVQVVLEVDT